MGDLIKFIPVFLRSVLVYFSMIGNRCQTNQWPRPIRIYVL